MNESNEKGLTRVLLKASESLGKSRQVPPELWKEMLQRQFLGLASSISASSMNGEITPEQINKERRANQERQRGLRDGLAGKDYNRCNNDYLLGYNIGLSCRNLGDELSKPENIGLY